MTWLRIGLIKYFMIRKYAMAKTDGAGYFGYKKLAKVVHNRPTSVVSAGTIQGNRGRIRTAAPVTRRRPRGRQTEGQNSEFVAKKLSYGRKPKDSFANLSKFVKSNISRTTFGLHAVSRFGGARGAIGLSQIQTAPGQQVIAPLHMYDLTSAMNTTNIAGVQSIVTPNTSWYLRFNNETNTAVGTLVMNTFRLTVEGSPNAPLQSNSYPGPSSVMRWAQAKMIFYAPTTIPSKITVQIVQFIDQDLCPDNRQGITSTVLNTRASAWYAAFMKKQMYSPIETTQSLGFKGIKVLHSEVFIMNPKETTEATSTHYKQLDIFKWMNRKCNYQWSQDQGTSTSDSVAAVNAGENETTVHPRAKVFLLITGQSGLGTADSGTVHPSYDLVIRTQHEQLSS